MSSPTDSGSDSDPDSNPVSVGGIDTPLLTESVQGGSLQEVKRKKKKNKPRRGAKKATGFEEFYCDPPMTVAQYQEEREQIYPVHRPFVERIEECIQRFRAQRRMDSNQNDLFSQYLMLGGVDATARQFSGTSKLGKGHTDGLTKAEIRDMEANDVIQRGLNPEHAPRFFNAYYPEHWDVDFTGVAAGYLSEHLHMHCGPHTELYATGVEVVSNFLKYVDRHDACPEYSADVRRAIALCEEARKEVPRVSTLAGMFPGGFNQAGIALFRDERNKEPFEYDANPFDKDTARPIFGIHLSLLLDVESAKAMAKALVKGSLANVKTAAQAYEIVNIAPASREARSRYIAMGSQLKGKFDIRPCGRLTAKAVTLENGWDTSNAGKLAGMSAEEADTFILEDDILKGLKVGMKMELEVCTIPEVDFKLIKRINALYPTFYTFLPQELMIHFKDPAMSDRPGPSVHSPGGDGNGEEDYGEANSNSEDGAAGAEGHLGREGMDGDYGATGDKSPVGTEHEVGENCAGEKNDDEGGVSAAEI